MTIEKADSVELNVFSWGSETNTLVLRASFQSSLNLGP